MFTLANKVGLVIGIADERSIAWGCAKAFHDCGAQLAITYRRDRSESQVRPLADALGAPVVLPLDVTDEAQIDGVFTAIDRQWGKLDFLLHSVGCCPRRELHRRVVDVSPEGFGRAMNVSCYSFIRLVHRAEALMHAGGACLTISYLGAERVIENYGIMGPVKAALEAIVRYAAAELGPKGITVNALSPGPLQTRAASGIEHFDALLDTAAKRAPTQHLSTIEDIGAHAAFLVSSAARNVTGAVHHIDGGYFITG